MIIDSHCHVGKGDGASVPADTMELFPKYLCRAEEAGIDRMVLFSVFHSDYRTANRKVAGIVSSNPARFYGFAFVHGQRDRGRINDMVREAVEEHGFCGIKVHRHDAEITREVCDAGRRFSLPVLYDVMGKVAVVDLLARDYPDVNFIIPHLGCFSDDWNAQGLLIDKLARYLNVYTDTAGVRRFDLVAQAVQKAGARKVLFGTDGPWLHPEVEIEKIYALQISESERGLILGGNILRLIKRSQNVRVRFPDKRFHSSINYPQ